MKKYSNKTLARAAVAMLEKHSAQEVSAALAQEMIKQKNGRSLDIFMDEVAEEMYRTHKYLHAEVTSARKLSATTKKSLESFLKKKCKAKTVDAVYLVDERLIGGVKVVTPLGMIDVSIARQLHSLTQRML